MEVNKDIERGAAIAMERMKKGNDVAPATKKPEEESDVAVAEPPAPPTPEIKPQEQRDAPKEQPKSEPKTDEKTEEPKVDEGRIVENWLKKEFDGKISSPAELKNLIGNRNLTPEEKEKAQKLYERAVIGEYISADGNSLDTYNKIQAQIGKDKTELVKEAYFEKYKDELASMTDDERQQDFERNYMLDKTLFTEAQVKRGEKKIANKAASIINELTTPIKEAESRLKIKTEQSEQQITWNKEVDSFIKDELPTLKVFKQTFKDAGQLEITSEAAQDILDDVAQKMKDPQLLLNSFTENGKTNKSKLALLLIKAAMWDKGTDFIANAAYGKGTTDAKAHLPSAPDFHGLGKTDTPNEGISDAIMEAGKHNKQMQQNSRRR